MSTNIKIKCCQCSYEFSIHQANQRLDDHHFSCPRCFAEMEYQMVESVRHAASVISDLNYHFAKYSSERSEPRFIIGFEGVDLWEKKKA